MVQGSLVYLILLSCVSSENAQNKNRPGFGQPVLNPFIQKLQQGFHHRGSNPDLQQTGLPRQSFPGLVGNGASGFPSADWLPYSAGKNKENNNCDLVSCECGNAAGRCSKDGFENFVKVGNPFNQCEDGCECYIPGWCPNPIFDFNHVCLNCDTPKEALHFAKKRAGNPSSHSSHYYVFGGPGLSFYVNKNGLDGGDAACFMCTYNLFACHADSYGISWLSCKLVPGKCGLDVGLVNGTIFPGKPKCIPIPIDI